MASTREQQMKDYLEELKEAGTGILSAVLVSSDAMPIASVGGEVQEELMSAMAFSLLQAGERVAADLNCGNVEQLYLKGEGCDFVILRVNDNAVLACTVDHDARMGIILLEVNRCGQKLVEII
ncbi:MAG: roadblock/LC7 domain-containing protein [Actinomycetota bacterium]|nr:roadblock/LC7 domain-containing protein [Actinomycetota bacterium]